MPRQKMISDIIEDFKAGSRGSRGSNYNWLRKAEVHVHMNIELFFYGENRY